MSINLITRGTATDWTAFTELAARVSAFVEENEPGTVRYECYGDEETGKFLWQEDFADDEALLVHLQHLDAEGFMDEILQVLQFESFTVLGEVSHPDVRAWIADSSGEAFPRLTGMPARGTSGD